MLLLVSTDLFWLAVVVYLLQSATSLAVNGVLRLRGVQDFAYRRVPVHTKSCRPYIMVSCVKLATLEKCALFLCVPLLSIIDNKGTQRNTLRVSCAVSLR